MHRYMSRTDAPRVVGLLICLICSLAGRCAGQTQPVEPPDDQISKAYLVTIEPGNESYERYGHDAIVIGDPDGGAAAFNYGVFDFNAPNFIGNFILGRMRYSMEMGPWPDTKQYYIGANRSIWLQELNLSPSRRMQLIRFLVWNSRDENKYYRYDYFRDNCTTRVRDALNDATGGQVKQQLSQIQTDKTFRWYTRIGMAKYPLLYAGLELAMGQPTDRKLSAWDESFLPAILMDYLDQVTIDDGHGGRVPMIKSNTQLYKSSRTPLAGSPPNWWWIFLLIGIAVGGAMAEAARREWRKTYLSIAIFWSVICSLAGLFMVFVWTFTDHAAAYRNENLFQFNPLSIVLIVLLFKRKWAEKAGQLSIAILAIAILNLMLKLTPWFYQWNWELIALALPAHAGLAMGLWTLRASKNTDLATESQRARS